LIPDIASVATNEGVAMLLNGPTALSTVGAFGAVLSMRTYAVCVVVSVGVPKGVKVATVAEYLIVVVPSAVIPARVCVVSGVAVGCVVFDVANEAD
jgi:hypothetical protein